MKRQIIMSKTQNKELNRIKAVLADTCRTTSKLLAGRFGESEYTVSRWCANMIQTSLSHINEIARILNFDIRTLIYKQTVW